LRQQEENGVWEGFDAQAVSSSHPHP
jgi:hypothetical protein